MMARPRVLKARLKDTTAADAGGVHPKRLGADRVDDEVVPVHLVALRGAAPMKACWFPSLRHMKALPGRLAPSAPASASSEVTEAGRSTRTQCQKPEGVGASGSKQVTT